MGRTLLIGSETGVWREWLKAERRNRDLIVLDPADANYGFPTRLVLLRGDRVVAWSFLGSLEPMRAPHLTMAALTAFLAAAESNAIVASFPYRPGPLAHQMTLLVDQMVRPTEIFVSQDAPLPEGCLTVGPEPVSHENTLPSLVLEAQRKAQWLALLKIAESHRLNLRELSIEGARLGSGTVCTDQVAKIDGLARAVWAERCGGTLLIVTADEPDDTAIAAALDQFGASRVQLVRPDAYRYLLCSLAREPGEDLGIGMVTHLDFESGEVDLLNTAVPPAHACRLRLGSLRVDTASGRELGEVRPWQV